MKRFAKLMLVGLGFALFILMMNPMPSHPAGGAPVTILNTPLPVTGSVSATIVGTPTVNVSSVPSINVQNAQNGSGVAIPLVERNADNPANQSFAMTLCSFSNSTCSSSAPNTFVVPSSANGGESNVRRLVIEYYTAQCSGIPATVAPTVDLFVVTAGQPNFYFIGPLLSDGDGFFYSNQQTRIYADAGSHLNLAMANTGLCNVTISGYLVLQ